jgi:hypothetical protein
MSAAFFAFAIAALGDRKRFCAPVIVFPACVTITGLCMVCLLVHYSCTILLSFLFLQTAFHTNNSVRYAGVFLGVAGAAANTPGILSYLQNNIAGQSKRAFTPLSPLAEVVLAVLSPPLSSALRTLLDSDLAVSDCSPTYLNNALIVYLSVDRHRLPACIILVCGINTAWYYHRNKQARAGTKLIEGRPGFYYTY